MGTAFELVVGNKPYFEMSDERREAMLIMCNLSSHQIMALKRGNLAAVVR
jgi:hypothetical protein